MRFRVPFGTVDNSLVFLPKNPVLPCHSGVFGVVLSLENDRNYTTKGMEMFALNLKALAALVLVVPAFFGTANADVESVTPGYGSHSVQFGEIPEANQMISVAYTVDSFSAGSVEFGEIPAF